MSLSCKRLSRKQTLFAIFVFTASSIISYVAVSWKLSLQWNPDVVYHPKEMSTYMIQPQHSGNISISIISNDALLQEMELEDASSKKQNVSALMHFSNEIEIDNQPDIAIKADRNEQAQSDASNAIHANTNKNGITETNINKQPQKISINEEQNIPNNTKMDEQTQTITITNQTKPEQEQEQEQNTSYHPEWGTINDPHYKLTNASYNKSDFSLWYTDGEGAGLFINASKYDPNGTAGYESFVFCTIPKVGCSSWKQVMRRIKGKL